jgi:hypothetical protein
VAQKKNALHKKICKLKNTVSYIIKIHAQFEFTLVFWKIKNYDSVKDTDINSDTIPIQII